MARKNWIEKNAPSSLSAVDAAFVLNLDPLGRSGTYRGSTNSLVPERKTVVLNIIASPRL